MMKSSSLLVLVIFISCVGTDVVDEPVMMTNDYMGTGPLSANLMGANGYVAQGTVGVDKDAADDLILTLSSDFETSFALGTYLYLSNTTSGSGTKTGGLEVAELTTNGSHEFNLTAIDQTIDFNSYQYAVILCKPAGITFGYGQLIP